MYYLYKKTRNTELPEFMYSFGKFEDFYQVAKVLEVPVIGNYNIRIKSDSYNDIIEFIRQSDSYNTLIVYIEISESLLNYISLQLPNVSLLSSQSNYEVFTELITKYKILFNKGCIRLMYSAIEHTYTEMSEALELLQKTYPNQTITEKELSELFVVDNIIYPRNVCIMYLRLDRWRESKLRKCVEYFGNDLVFYSIRKNVNQFLKDKTKYLKTGKGSGIIKMLPTNNIVRMFYAVNSGRRGFKDIVTIMKLYEKGLVINDYLQERTISYTDDKYYNLR